MPGSPTAERTPVQSLIDSSRLKGSVACNRDTDASSGAPACRVSFYLLDETGVFGTVGVPAGFQTLLTTAEHPPATDASSSRGPAHADASQREEKRVEQATSQSCVVPSSTLSPLLDQQRTTCAKAEEEALSALEEELYGREKNNKMALIRNPTQCLQKGDTIIWMIAGAFPVYLRNSLLNTAAEFDASQYLKVQGDLAYESYDEKKPVTYFAFSFTVPGQFVFASNVSQSHQAIFRVLDDGVACDNDARFPHPTEFASLAAAGIQMRDDVLLEPALADVELLFWGTLCILLTFVVLVSWLRKLQFNKKQRESVASERLEKRSGPLSVVARKQAVAQTFGVHAVAHRTRAEIENLLSHVIESGRDVDSRARATRLSPEELEAFLLAFQDAADALDDAKEPSKPPFDLRMFETAYNRLARARLVLGEYFRDRKLGVTQLGIEQVKILDNLQNFVAPIIRKVDWKLDESSQLQKTISAMTKACEKLVDELRAPQAFFASDALDDSAASSSRVQQYMLSTPFSLERGGKKAVFLALAEEVTGVVCMTRGESPTLPVLAQYLEALRGSLEDEDESEPGASVSLSAFVQSTTDSLESALEEVLKHRERQASLDVQLTERPFSDAIARARIADRCEQDLFSLLLDCAEALLTDSAQTMADEKGRRRDSARERRRSSKAAGDEGDERADAGERGQETGDDGRKGAKKTEGILRVGGGQERQRENPVTEIQEAIQTLCDRQLEEMSRTLATQQQAYRAALDKRESAATHQIEGRQLIEKVLLSQFHQFFKATEARRLSQFYQHLESSRIAKLREDLKEEMYEMERTRRREAWAQAEYEEKRKKALQHFEAQIKATAEAFKGEKDGVVLATLDTLESLQERRNAALEVVHSMETVLLKAKATQAKDLADELFEQQAERMKKDLGGRRARFLLVAQNIVRLHDRIASGDVIPTAQLEDMVEDAAAILEDLRRSQANERREWLKGQREVRDAISERHKGTLQSKTADVKDATRQYVAQEIGLYSELFRREEDALLPHGKRAVIDTVEAVFAKQLKQQRKAYHLVLEESEAELRDSPGKGTETYPAPGFPHTQETGGEFMTKKSRFEEANEQRLALKEDEKAKQIQDLETRLSEVREKRSEALRGVAELEVEVTERYLIKAATQYLGVRKAAASGGEKCRKDKRQEIAFLCSGFPVRGRRAKLGRLGASLGVSEKEAVLCFPFQAEYENNVRQRSRAETRGVLAGSLAARGAAVEADENVNRLLLKLREKRGDVHASLFFLDDLVGTICDAKFSTREMVQIDAQYDRATRELEEEFERELRALQEEFDSDTQRLEAELAEVRLRLRRTEEMEKSRLEVDRRLREATASSEEEIAAVRRDFAQRIDRVQKEFDSEREAQEQAFQAKLAHRRELFNKRRQKLAGKAQAEEARTQEDLQRKKSVAHSQRKKATFELLLDEARSHPNDTTIRQLHKFMSSELSEVVNATVLEQLAEKSARLTAVSTEMQKKQADERRAAEHELDGKISAAEKKLASASEENAAQMIEDVANLKQMKEAKLRELEATFSLKLESALQVERLAIEPVQAERVFQIQQESLKNMVKVLGEFVVLNDPTAIGLTDQVKQAQARIEMERSRMKEIAGMKVLDLDKILKEKEAELKKQMEASIAALREKLKAQQEREEQLQREKHEAEMKKRKEEQRARRLKQLRRMINSAQPDDPEAADDIFKKYQDDAERLEAALAKERARQHMLLQSQLFQRANRKEHRLRQEGEGELSEEWSRLKKTRELAAVPQETGNGTKDADELDEEEMWKYFFTVRVAEEVGKKAKTVQELLRAALKQLTSGPPKDEVGGALAAEMAEFATPDSIENLVDKLSRLTEALVVSEDDEDEE
ncbi:GCC2 and GCC3 domain-containing protein [Toxoplasma gondii GAB2-2007-GAL-DOM2]|uniref:GCC2 and GCC3 domain-containing protein n=1 Tax=Toxoplasma gondii GAB2-2007-GAL-DOM2 TaxID=1130820 RepID=A0A086JSP3_TOXGO|nr:GCC2 and GCC3 domain-containing protein [Toxoplasma gondii GAB2-2007-GAL-DOM2]